MAAKHRAKLQRRLWVSVSCVVLVMLVGSSVGVTQNTPVLSVTPTSQDFGVVAVGQCSSLRIFTVRNTGGGTLSGTAVTTTPFNIVSGGSFSNLSANQTAEVAVQFCPTAAGQFNNVVTFTSNGGTIIRPVTGATPVRITVTKSGSGTITSSPAGIDCGSTCQADFGFGTSVTLVATAAANWAFRNWGGDCSGTNTTCTIPSINTNKTVTATFERVIANCYSDNVEGTPHSDVIQMCEGITESITVRGDGNGDFVDGPDPCSLSLCGSDLIIGSDIDDQIYGDDSLRGWRDTGRDIIYGRAGNDSIYGESGNDRIYGEADNDVIDGGSGNDRLDGGDDDDILQGGPGRDVIFGGMGDDTIDGGPGNDILRGGEGLDTIDGGTGNDTIEGGLDSDFLVGGGGNDTFIVQAGDAGDDIETIICTQAHNEIGRVVFKGEFSNLTLGRFRNSTVTIQDTAGMFEIITGPGVCILSRGR
jgi:Ca2+-binding RTX toxin-like protein